jgi:uncharacterized protein YktB (UPF0637 family)
MAGVGLEPSDFRLFEIDDPEQRGAALELTLLPKLVSLGGRCLPGLSRVAGRELYLHAARVPRRREAPPEEALVVFSESPRGYRGLPFLGVVVTREHLHARVGVRGDSPRREPMRRAIEREAANLARKGKPFRRMRQFVEWNYEGLPEIAPAHSSAFWLELAEGLAVGRPGLDVGISWTSDEARSVALGDLLGVFRDLAPVYKTLVNAQ